MIYDYVQTKPELDEDLLIHYGIPGMKWANHIYKSWRSKRAGKKLIKKHAKARKSAEKIWNKYTRKRDKNFNLIRKQRKKWMETGRARAYSDRYDDIKAARKKAHDDWLHDPKRQRAGQGKAARRRANSLYYTNLRRKAVKQTEKNKNSYSERNKKAAETARRNRKAK